MLNFEYHFLSPLKGGDKVDDAIALLIAVAANLITDYIRKWLDRDKKKNDQPKED